MRGPSLEDIKKSEAKIPTYAAPKEEKKPSLLDILTYPGKRANVGLTAEAPAALINLGASAITRALEERNSPEPVSPAFRDPKTLLTKYPDPIGIQVLQGLMRKNATDEQAEKITNKAMNLAAPLEKKAQDAYAEGQNMPKLVQTAGDVGGVVGMMAPALALSAVTKKPNAGIGLMSAMAAGSGAKEAYTQTGDIKTAWDYGLAAGATEFTVERLAGGIPLLGGGITDGIVRKMMSKIASKPVVSRIVKESAAAAGEGFEEVIVGLVDPFLRHATFDPDASHATKEELFEQFTIGALAAMVLRAGYAPINKRAQNHSTSEVVTALNGLAERIPTQHRPEPLQFTTRTTLEEVQEYHERIIAATEAAAIEIRNRDDINTPIQDEEITDNLELLEAQEAYEAAMEQLEVNYGTANLTPEQKELARTTLGVDIDAAEDQLKAAEADNMLTPKARLEKAVATGTASKYYSEGVINRYLAQKQAAEEQSNPTVYIQDKAMTKTEFKAAIQEKRPDITEVELEEVFARAQYENMRNEETEDFVKKANGRFSKYGVSVEVSYDLPTHQNGHYDPVTKKITLNGKTIKSQGVASFILSHEITHHAIAKDPELLIDLKVAMKALGYDINSMVEERRAAYEQQTGRAVEDAYLEEEAIADFVSIIMRDASVLEQLARTRPTLLERIRDFLVEHLNFNKQDRLSRKYKREAIKRIQAALDGKPMPESSVVPPSRKADDGVNAPAAPALTEHSGKDSIALENLYRNNKYSLEPITRTVQINNKTQEVRTYTVSIQPEILAGFKDLPADHTFNTFEEVEAYQTSPERIKDWNEIYAQADRIVDWQEAKKQGKGKIKDVPIVSLTKGCQRMLTTIERVANGVLPDATRLEACFGGDCWVNRQVGVLLYGQQYVETKDLKLADPAEFDKWLKRPSTKKFLDRGDFVRHGQQGDDSHLFATGIALEWLKAYKANGLTKKNVFVTAGYAPVTVEQYAALKPYSDLFEIHFSVSGWFHKNEVMLRLGEFKKAKEAGLPVALRIITNKDNISGVSMPNEMFLFEKMEELDVTQNEVLETPYHDDGIKGKKKQKRSDPIGLFENVCCETGACGSCGVSCMVDINKNRNTLKPFLRQYRTNGEIPSIKKYSLNISGRVDNEGKSLNNAQHTYFKASKVRDAEGNLLRVYHGTPSGDFHEFKLPDYLSTLMSQQGAGFYFTDKANASSYMKAVNKTSQGKKRLFEVYLNITNPLEISNSSHALTREQVLSIVESGDYDWFFNTGLYHHTRLDKSVDRETAINTWVDRIMQQADPDILRELTRAFKGGNSNILDTMRQVTGHDGVKHTDSYGDIWVAWSPEQIKAVANESPTSDPDIRYSVERLYQAISSADTSLNQIAATFKSKWFEPGALNIDIGGGEYDLGTNYLNSTYGTENLVYDPFNRPEEYNQAIVERLQSGERGDTATVNNVLNIIAEEDVRINAVKQAAKAVKSDGTAYFLIYEGSKDGEGKKTTRGWQNNRRAETYIDEVKSHFEDVVRKGNLLIATNPKDIDSPAIWELGNDQPIRFSLDKSYESQYNTRKEIRQQIKKYYQKDGESDVAVAALTDLKEAVYISSKRGEVDRFRVRDGRAGQRKDFSGAGRVVGKGFADELIDKGKINLTGIRLRGAKDLATLAQVYRDPRFETFRIFFMRGNQIVGQQAVSSRLPTSAKVFVEKDRTTFLNNMRKKMQRLGADGYYLLHNHPAGSPKPSPADIQVTHIISSALPGFKKHIIINSNIYTEISRNKAGQLTGKENVPLDLGKEKLLAPSMPNPFLGLKITSTDTFARIAKNVQLDNENMSVVLFVTGGKPDSPNGMVVQAVMEVDNRFIVKNPDEFRGFLNNRMREYGGASAFIVSENFDLDTDLALGSLIRSGDVTDVYIKHTPDTHRNSGIHPEREGWQERRREEAFKERTPQPEKKYSLEFKQWFGDSKVVDEDGKPLVVYHGTGRDFSVFNTLPENLGTLTEAKTAKLGAFFTENTETADDFANFSMTDTHGSGRIMPVYLSIKKPFNPEKLSADEIARLEKEFPGFADRHYVVDNNPDQLTYKEIEKIKKEQTIIETYTEKGSLVEGRKPGGYEAREKRAKELEAQGYKVKVGRMQGNYGVTLWTLEAVPDVGESYGRDFFKILQFVAKDRDAQSKLRSLGYDGIIVKTEMDAPFWSEYTGKINQYIAFDPNQIKSVYNQGSWNPENPDIRYSLQRDTDGAKLTPGQQAFFKDTKAVDANGDLIRVYHGTMSDFWEFKPGNAEGDMGAGFYFTDSDTDVWENYANEKGPDLLAKIERYQDQLMDSGEYTEEEALEEARRAFITRTEPRVIEGYLNITNPVILGGEDSTFFEYNMNYDEEADAYDEPSGDFVDFVESVKNVLEDYEDGGGNSPNSYIHEIDSLYEYFADDGEIRAEYAIKRTREILADFFDYDNDTRGGSEIVRQALEDIGFDGIIDHTVARKWGSKSGRMHPMPGVDEDTTHYIVFNSNQAKEFDNENPTDSPDIRYSLNKSLDDILADWEGAKQKYGTKDPGMNPRVESRANQVPEQINDETRVSDFMRSAYEAPSTPDEFLTPLQIKIMSGTGSYAVLTDKAAQDVVNRKLARKGIAEATKDWRGLVGGRRTLNKTDLVLGEMLLIEAADRGDVVEWEKLVAELSAEATRAGQNLQAFSMLKKLSPQGRAYSVRSFVNKLQQDMDERTKGKGVELILDEDLLKQLGQAKTIEEMEQIEELIIKDVAQQVPATISSRVIAWRYLSMLGNARTHIRNIVSNMAMAVARTTKDTVAGAAEDVLASTIAKDMKRTKTLKLSSPEAKAFAAQDWEVMRPSMLRGGAMGFENVFERYKLNFGNRGAGKILNFLDKGNSNLLNWEDAVFMGVAYRAALAGYMTANKLTPEMLSANTKEAYAQLASARKYAVEEGLKATYREANTLATALNSLEHKNVISQLLIGGLMPFKKTPLNIIKRGVEYSPAGLIDALTVETGRLVKGDTTAAHYLDRLASGLTGSGAFALGVYMAMMGLAKAGGGDDKEEYYEQMQGVQPYSIQIGNRNYTLDWLTPISMPLMAGVELVSAVRDGEDLNFNRILEAVLTTADPLTELSMLQGLNQAIGSFEDNKIGAAAASAAQSYVGQFVPTLFGQVARTVDPTRRTTYASKDTDFPGGKKMETFKNKMMNKADVFNLAEKEPYVDMWGRHDVRPDNIPLRAFEQMVAPWYAKPVQKTFVDDELSRVFAVNENTGVIPGTPKPYLRVDGERYDMSPSDYTDFKRKTGREAYDSLDKIFRSKEYQWMAQESKEKVIVDAFSYARENAKADYIEKRGIDAGISSAVDKVDTAREAGIDLGQYFVVMQTISETKSDLDTRTGKSTTKDRNGLLTRKTKVLDYLDSTDLNQEQKDVIMRLNGYKVD